MGRIRSRYSAISSQTRVRASRIDNGSRTDRDMLRDAAARRGEARRIEQWVSSFDRTSRSSSLSKGPLILHRSLARTSPTRRGFTFV